ncbi:sensor histidine kinase [Streptomyces sp. NPDC059786]|uniref:sensor histidine kinase n=1 Tax=Streptomyces sp. NPDC059786 TaxID=3346946 RepID=UPI0036583C6C
MHRMDSFAGRRMPRAFVDAALAAVLAASCLAVPGMLPPEGPVLRAPDAWWLVIALAATLPLAVHRLAPVPVLLVMAVSSALLQALHYVPRLASPDGTSIGPSYTAVAVAVFLTARRSSSRTATRVTGILIPVAAVTEAVLAPSGYRIAAWATEAVLLVAAWALGRLARARAAIAQQALERAAALEREQTANERAAVMEERARIARELHDIVAHNVSLMVVQTIAADRIQDRDGARAHELHGTIEETGRATVTELRRLLDVLRTDEEADADPSRQPPQPTVDALPALVDAVREAGLDVGFTTSGTPAELPAGSQLTVYRVVQEALTNTLKHAGPTHTSLSVAWEADRGRLVVRVCDDGPVPDRQAPGVPKPAKGAGHGLVGMRERVAAVGGSLHTGPRPAGGYCVHVTVPLPAAPGSGTPHEEAEAHEAHEERGERGERGEREVNEENTEQHGSTQHAGDPRPAGR